MKLNVIDKILTAIQDAGDAKGVDVGAIPLYQEACQVLTDYEFGEVISQERKQKLAEDLRWMCYVYNVNYWEIIVKNSL